MDAAEFYPTPGPVKYTKYLGKRTAAMVLPAALPLALALGAALALGVAVKPATALAGDYDGNWTVRIVTEHGHCDRTASYDVRVANGKVLYTSYSSVSLYGTVSPQGAVRVMIRHFNDGADGSGMLTKRSGSGGWSGHGSNGPCSGRWAAIRR
jgi:hypothetical protein